VRLPPFGCFFGVRSLSLTFADFGTLRFFVLADFFDTGMVLVSFHLIGRNPVHPGGHLYYRESLEGDKLVVTRMKRVLIAETGRLRSAGLSN
jgi:hypothetical protein